MDYDISQKITGLKIHMIKVYRLCGSEFSVGRMRPCTIVLESDKELSAQHIKLTIKNGACELLIYGKNGTYVNDRFYAARERLTLNFADVIKLPGITMMWLEKYVVFGTNFYDVKTELSELTDEEIEEEANMRDIKFTEFNIPPRTFFSVDEETVELDNPPEKKVYENQSVIVTIGPAFSMALPMIIGFLVTAFAQKNAGQSTSAFMYTGLITAVSSALIGVFWGLMNIKNRKKQLFSEEIKRTNLYIEYVKNAEDKIRDIYVKKTGNMRLLYKSAAEIMIGGADKHLLWNRTGNDDDFMFVRLGLGSVPFEIKIDIQKDKFSVQHDELKELPKKLKEKYIYLSDVPVGTDISKNKMTGILSDDNAVKQELLMVIISQLAVSISPYVLKLCCIFSSCNEYGTLFESVRFLPHFRLGELILFTTDELKAGEINKAISDVCDSENNENISFVIFTDDLNLISKPVKECTNVYFVVVSGTYESFPPNLKVIIQRDNNFSGLIDFSDGKIRRQEIYFDNVQAKEMHEYSRILMGLYKPEITGNTRKLPDKVPFYELYGKNIDEELIVSNWEKNRTFENITAYIGKDEEGITELDLHERKMGPHGLIAGTTGSGKSEILQTIILSLAVNYSPLDVSFFLIDYKGGSTASLFNNLPHLAGSISNLSGRMINRAMASIHSENERRQKLFLDNDVNNISEYQQKFYQGRIKTPLPHILIIIDEFAELKREEPAFMDKLISVARVGRSLGVHLILATQKPSGTVDDNIWSNSRFKICLRVQDKMDSNEMLHKPDAASLTNPGRAYIQVGNDEIYKLFQSAYTMDKSRIDTRGNIFILDNAGRKIKEEKRTAEINIPQLYETVENISLAYNKLGLTYRNKLWLKPLGNKIIYENGGKDEHDICIGIYDDPSHQRQDFLNINILNAGNHVILGALQSGKSTLLSVISLALLKNENPETCNLYFIDFSNGILSPFKESHMTGGYIDSENEGDLIKLFIMLTEIIDDRKSKLKGENFRQHFLRNRDFPAVYLIIDELGNLREKTECRYDKELLYILKNGEAAGVYIIASSINVSASELPQRFFETFKATVPLKLSDKYAYKESLRIAGDIKLTPEDIKGRGLFKLNDECVEFQTFLPVDAYDDYERMNALSGEVKKLSDDFYKDNPGFTGVKRMPKIPKRPILSQFENEDFSVPENKIPVGYEELSGKIFYMPVDETVYVSGRKGSGKKNFLNVCHYIAKKYGYDLNIKIYDEALPFDELLKMKSDAGENPYVVHFGGALDRQNFADFSYIPYSQQTKLKNAGQATVRKVDNEKWHGDIIVPLGDIYDNN